MVFLHFDLLDLCYEFGAQYVLDDIFYIYIYVYIYFITKMLYNAGSLHNVHVSENFNT